MFNVLEFKLEAVSELIYILHPRISRELTQCGLAGIKKTWLFLNIQTLGSGCGMYGVAFILLCLIGTKCRFKQWLSMRHRAYWKEDYNGPWLSWTDTPNNRNQLTVTEMGFVFIIKDLSCSQWWTVVTLATSLKEGNINFHQAQPKLL